MLQPTSSDETPAETLSPRAADPLAARPRNRLDEVRSPSVVVFRALMLGDLLCATPALRALRSGLPRARIVLVGLPWARELAARLPSVDEFVAFPGWPGLPEGPEPDAATRRRFLAAMQARHFDLALQLHGSGPVVNELVAAFGARRTAGFASPDAWRPKADAARFTDWPRRGSEVERLLSLLTHLGLKRRGRELDFPLAAPDREAAAALLAALPGGAAARPFAIVHPGSQLPSRRWPADRFADVADTLAARGLAIVLTGSAAEAGLTQAVARAMHRPSLDLAGRTTLWSLGALVERAALVLANDTGVSHIAAALGTPSVIVASGSDVGRWAPADPLKHRVLWHDVECRPCAHVVCPIGHPCARGVGTGEVAAAALALLPERVGSRPGAAGTIRLTSPLAS